MPNVPSLWSETVSAIESLAETLAVVLDDAQIDPVARQLIDLQVSYARECAREALAGIHMGINLIRNARVSERTLRTHRRHLPDIDSGDVIMLAEVPVAATTACREQGASARREVIGTRESADQTARDERSAPLA